MKVYEEVPISIDKLKNYIKNKYDIELEINKDFIDNVLDEKYDCHIYKNGKNKDMLKIKIKKNNGEEYSYKEEDNNTKNKNLKLNNFLMSLNYKYDVLYYDFYDLINKYKILRNMSKIIIFNFKKINEIIKENKINEINNDILLLLNKTIKQEKIIEKIIEYT